MRAGAFFPEHSVLACNYGAFRWWRNDRVSDSWSTGHEFEYWSGHY